jgi:hypothetical protein
VEEGKNSPSQEIGLNRELAGNNNQCDSVTSTGGRKVKMKEMYSVIEHQKEQRRILGQNMVIFYGHNS